MTAMLFLFVFYLAFLEDWIKGKHDAVFFSGDNMSALVFLIIHLVIIVFHAHFFNVYKTNRIWQNTTVLEITGFIINFGYSGLFTLCGLFYFFTEFGTGRASKYLLAMLIFTYGGYLFIESVFIIRYLKRDTTKETSRSIEEIGLD